MSPPEIYDIFEKLEDSRAWVRFNDGAEYLLAIYSCSHVRQNDTFLADIVGEGAQSVSYQWEINDVARIEDETGRLLYEKTTA